MSTNTSTKLGGSMARINIEERWWSDPRRTNLILKIGFEADSAVVNLWRTGQEHWGNKRSLIPVDSFFRLKFAQEMIDVGLVEIRGSEVYVRGAAEQFEWHASRRDQAREAGKKSAEARKAKLGTAQPKGGKGHKKSERDPNEIRTNAERDPNASEPSDSGSGSGSGISSSNKNITNYTTSVDEEGECEGKQSSAAKFEVLPELADEAINDVLEQISPKAQTRWLKSYKDPVWIKEVLNEAVAYIQARGDEQVHWGIWLHKSLVRARAARSRENSTALTGSALFDEKFWGEVFPETGKSGGGK